MWSVKEKEVLSIGGKEYLETWGDPTGYVQVFRTPEGIILYGEVKKGNKRFFIKSIEKKYGKILNVNIDEVENGKFKSEVKPKVKKIYNQNKEALKKEKRFPY